MTKLRREIERERDRNNRLIVAGMFLKMRSSSRNPSLSSTIPETILANGGHNEELEYLLCRLFVANLPRALTHVPKGSSLFLSFPLPPSLLFLSIDRERRGAFHETFERQRQLLALLMASALTTRFIRFDRLFVTGEGIGQMYAPSAAEGNDDSSKGVNREHECWVSRVHERWLVKSETCFRKVVLDDTRDFYFARGCLSFFVRLVSEFVLNLLYFLSFFLDKIFKFSISFQTNNTCFIFSRTEIF